MKTTTFRLDNDALAAIRAEELTEFQKKIPKSRTLYEESRKVPRRGSRRRPVSLGSLAQLRTSPSSLRHQ